ncbi:MFS transporter [Polymorphospora sp. 2-325]|uniref:MFS transporter n=1 Tax=Polymorphospora lycopeni TaxID=3140240 RepID=A0ABV5CLI4_9ACTN
MSSSPSPPTIRPCSSAGSSPASARRWRCSRRRTPPGSSPTPTGPASSDGLPPHRASATSSARRWAASSCRTEPSPSGSRPRPDRWSPGCSPSSCCRPPSPGRPAARPGRQRRLTARPGRQRRLTAMVTALRQRRLRRTATAILVGWLCFTGYATVLPVELADRLAITAVTYGVIIAISGVVAVVVRGLLLGRLVRTFGETRLMVGGAALIAASMLLAPVVPAGWAVPVLPLTWALGASVLFPCAVAEMSRLAGPDSVGLAMGAAAMLAGIGSVAGPLVAGTVRTFVWAPGPFVAGAALMLAVAALVGTRAHGPGAAAGGSVESPGGAGAGDRDVGRRQEHAAG